MEDQYIDTFVVAGTTYGFTEDQYISTAAIPPVLSPNRISQYSSEPSYFETSYPRMYDYASIPGTCDCVYMFDF